VAAFKAKKQDPSGAFVFPAYSAVKIMADAVKATGKVDTEAMANYMRKTTFSTPTGDLAFDAKGDLKEFSFVVYQWHADGSKSAVK
jgi:branched-chain amino acid transport system substrate-binding protein